MITRNLIVFILALILTGCSPAGVNTPPAGTATGTPVVDPTPLPSATSRPTNTATLAPSVTPTPTVYVSPTPALITVTDQNIGSLQSLNSEGFGFIGRPPDFSIRSMAFSADGSNAAASDSNGGIFVWKIFTGQIVASLSSHRASVRSLAFHPNGNVLASGDDDGAIKLLDLKEGKEITTVGHFRKASRSISSLIFSQNGEMLISGDFDGRVTFWNTSEGRESASWSDPNGFISSLALSPNGEILAIGTLNHVTLWDVVKGRVIRTLDFDLTWGRGGSDVEGVLFSPDGELVAAANMDNNVMIWDASTGVLISSILGKETITRMNSGVMTFSPDGNILVFGNDQGEIIVWDVSHTKRLHIISLEYCIPVEIAFLRTGTILGIGCETGVIQFWGIP